MNNKYETMRRIICGLFVWNLILTAGILFNWNDTEPLTPTSSQTVNEQICELELIPEGDLL